MRRTLTRSRSYFMAVAFALSTSDPLTEAQRQLNISTQALVKFFVVDRVPKSVSDIMGMFVHMLEHLTCTRQGHCSPSLLHFFVPIADFLFVHRSRAVQERSAEAPPAIRAAQFAQAVQVGRGRSRRPP